MFPGERIHLSRIKKGLDIPIYPPEGTLDPGEVQRVQLGALINNQLVPEQLRIGYDGVGRGHEAQWQHESTDQPTVSYCSEG